MRNIATRDRYRTFATEAAPLLAATRQAVDLVEA